MEISDDYKKMFVKEINFVAKKMDESPDAFSKLYYFSGLFGFLHRILNLEFHPDLVVAHSILKTTYGDFMTRLQHLVKEPDKTVILTEEQMNKLSSLSKELGKKIKNDENIFETLKKFVLLAYSVTGNGFYLMQKGTLKI
jgi:hypothetical protein